MNRKRTLAICMLLGMAASMGLTAAQAEEGGIASATANASVVAPEITYITAPFAGTLLPFSAGVGDTVAANQQLFELDTVKVYAPQSGTLGAMFAQEGDDAEGILQRYGALCTIEPENAFYLDASSANAYYNNPKNKFLHVGETLYLKEGDEKGTGIVTSVSQMAYTVEILTGDYDMGDTVKCYRESGYASDSDTGSGQVMRADDLRISASGRVYAVHKRAGDSVSAGDLLLEMIDITSAPGTATCDVASPTAGAIQALYVQPGAQVYRGQLLCEVADLSQMELSVELDEVYLSRVAVNGVLNYVLDAYPERMLQGAVTEIKPLGTARQNAAYYDVRVSLPSDTNLLPGMNATVTLPLQ